MTVHAPPSSPRTVAQTRPGPLPTRSPAGSPISYQETTDMTMLIAVAAVLAASLTGARRLRIRVRRHLDAIAQIRADARFARTHRIDL